MTAGGKRSAPAVASSLLWVAALAGCSSTTPSIDGLEVVAVADDRDGWLEGVHAHPLEPGESLLFDFGRSVEMVWTMDGVPYELELQAHDDDGEPIARLSMPACPGDCDSLELEGVTARYWTETRPAEP